MHIVSYSIARTALFSIIIAASIATVRAEKLVGYWKFDQEGGEFENLTGGHSPAKVEPEEFRNKPPLVEDQVSDLNKVFDFDGSGHMWIAAPINLLTENVAIELWVKIEEMPKEKSAIMAAENGLLIFMHPDGTLTFLAAAGDSGSKWFHADILQAIHPGEWVHLMACIGNGVQQLLMQDGAGLRKSPEVSIDNPRIYGGFATVGINGSDHSMPFCGRIAALKIHNDVLSEEDFLNSNP